MGSDFGESARDDDEGGVTEANDERILVNFIFFILRRISQRSKEMESQGAPCVLVS